MQYKKAYVEITNICNLRCEFCPETKRTSKYMDLKDFTHVAKEIKAYTDYIYFHLMGEPLLHPELKGFLHTCNLNKLKVNITTNGTLLLKRAEDLLSSPALRKVSVSLHSFEANRKADLDKYLDEVAEFVTAASDKNIICELRLWNMDGHETEGRNSLNAYIVQSLEQAFGTEGNIQQALEKRGNVKLRDKVFLHTAEKFEWPDPEREEISNKVFCYGLRDQFGVLVDGTVVPCCLDNDGNMPLGNIFEQPLSDILNSERARRIYDGFTGRTAVEEMCRKCGYAQRYGRI